MDLYLNNCYKAAEAAATKAAASSLTADREHGDTVSGAESVVTLLLAPGRGLGVAGGRKGRRSHQSEGERGRCLTTQLQAPRPRSQ